MRRQCLRMLIMLIPRLLLLLLGHSFSQHKNLLQIDRAERPLAATEWLRAMFEIFFERISIQQQQMVSRRANAIPPALPRMRGSYQSRVSLSLGEIAKARSWYYST